MLVCMLMNMLVSKAGAHAVELPFAYSGVHADGERGYAEQQVAKHANDEHVDEHAGVHARDEHAGGDGHVDD